MPSLPGLAGDHGVSWTAYAASGHYPVAFYTQLAGSPHLSTGDQFVVDARKGALPRLALLWHNSPYDEHPPANVTEGMNTVWQAVDAVVQGGGWQDTGHQAAGLLVRHAIEDACSC